MENFTVVGAFDGMSCAQIALNKIGLVPSTYYAIEVDKYCVATSKKIFPNTVQLGDIRNVKGSDIGFVHYLVGGSPCQGFSFSGKRKGMVTTEMIEVTTLDHYLQLKNDNFVFDGQSYLFWEFVRLKQELLAINPKMYWLLENVKMKRSWQKILSNGVGVNPIKINSSLLSAQNRPRLYWTNIFNQPNGLFGDVVCQIPQPKDKQLFIVDVLEINVAKKYFLTDKMIDYFINKKKLTKHNFEIRDYQEKSKSIRTGVGKMAGEDNYIVDPFRKAKCFTAGGNSAGLHSQMEIIVYNSSPRSSTTGKGGTGILSRNDGKSFCVSPSPKNVVHIKSGTIRTHKDGLGFRVIRSGKGAAVPARAREDGSGQNAVMLNGLIRRLTPRECGRLQTVPDEHIDKMFEAGLSDTQLYKMFGNGMTCDVIAYISSFAKFK